MQTSEDIRKANTPTLLPVEACELFTKSRLFLGLRGILKVAIYTYIIDEQLHQIKSRVCCNELRDTLNL